MKVIFYWNSIFNFLKGFQILGTLQQNGKKKNRKENFVISVFPKGAEIILLAETWWGVSTPGWVSCPMQGHWAMFARCALRSDWPPWFLRGCALSLSPAALRLWCRKGSARAEASSAWFLSSACDQRTELLAAARGRGPPRGLLTEGSQLWRAGHGGGGGLCKVFAGEIWVKRVPRLSREMKLGNAGRAAAPTPRSLGSPAASPAAAPWGLGRGPGAVPCRSPGHRRLACSHARGRRVHPWLPATQRKVAVGGGWAEGSFHFSSLCIHVPSIAPFCFELCPQELCWRPNPRTSECDLIWKTGSLKVHLVKMGP